ncbi:AAA family ATPase [Salipiger aestuarii]|uniref:AAA family ATPase n=1 Tax=Salipiger aestuarii TaxID=568098 RepID=UPI001CC2A922|nr:AAA family ATPase [Salipiger aestuarii]
MRKDIASQHVVLSGCSGGGKSTLLGELASRGFETVEEPGRRIVEEELRGNGKALPWVDIEAFARRAVGMAVEDRKRHRTAKGWVFFDRGLLDAAAALEHAAGVAVSDTMSGHNRFHRQVFLTPPWPEIYHRDSERQQDLKEGIAEYHRLIGAFDRLGYDPVILPKVDVKARADFILHTLPWQKGPD